VWWKNFNTGRKENGVAKRLKWGPDRVVEWEMSGPHEQRWVFMVDLTNHVRKVQSRATVEQRRRNWIGGSKEGS